MIKKEKNIRIKFAPEEFFEIKCIPAKEGLICEIVYNGKKKGEITEHTARKPRFSKRR